jgi:transposase
LATDSIARASRKGCPNYPIDFKRQLAALACTPNVSVSKLAAKHGINANMVFKWRRQYRAGYLGVPGTDSRTTPVTLIPVLTHGVSERQPSARQSDPVIEVVIDDVTLRLHGGVDPITLSTVLDCLARRR